MPKSYSRINKMGNNNFEEELRIFSSSYIRDYAYDKGNNIYEFMNKHDIGKSTFGSLMDSAATGKDVIAHRLYGHNLFYDFPIKEPGKILHFMEHELSDIFTKQGLPILPGEMLEDLDLLKYCDKLTKNWNFVNFFDVLTGTIAIYDGTRSLKRAFQGELSIDSFEDFAKSFGMTAITFAIAFSTCNPFALIGASLKLTASIRGLLNDGALIRFNEEYGYLHASFIIDELSIEKIIESISPYTIMGDCSPDAIIGSLDDQDIIDQL